jgi:hypothetical protein
LKKRCKELEKSRDLWKRKSQLLKEQVKTLTITSGKKAKAHQYSLLLVMLLVELKNMGQ